MKDVFVSYTSNDTDYAFLIVKYLEQRGINCFIAPRDIDPGRAYAANLMRALEDCKAVVLIASSNINNSEHVLNEVDVIVEKKKPILPVFIEEFDLNDDFRYYLGRKQWILAYPNDFNTYLVKIMDSIIEHIPNKKSIEFALESGVVNQKTKTTFDYIPDRGIMINPEDHQRNVSFRSDTLNNMMGGIFEEVKNISNIETAEKMFFSCGYLSGKSFADRINNQWDTGHTFDELNKKLIKWCHFDSNVGWGKFYINVCYDEQDFIIGTLTINEAILVDKSQKRRTCQFVKGYCTGVIETLLDFLDVSLECVECPLKNRFNSHCIFNIKVKEQE